MVCGKHDSTVPGASSGCGVEGMWVEGMWVEGMSHMVTHHSRCSNTTAPARAPRQEKQHFAFSLMFAAITRPGRPPPSVHSFPGRAGQPNHSQGFGRIAVTLQIQTPPAQGGFMDVAAVPKGNTLLVEQAPTFTTSHMCTLFV